MSHILEPNQAEYLGAHLILDLWTYIGDENLCDIMFMENIMKEAARISGATVLSSKMHEFGKGCGITGIVVLSESHISVHTWPEKGYAAFDIFMCGKCDPSYAMKYIVKNLNSRKYHVIPLYRGFDSNNLKVL